MMLKRGEDWFKQIGRIAFHLSRSSDGKWERGGKPVGFLYVIRPYTGRPPHNDKRACGVVFGEFSLLVGWYPKNQKEIL